jgi:hypothetical protein
MSDIVLKRFVPWKFGALSKELTRKNLIARIKIQQIVPLKTKKFREKPKVKVKITLRPTVSRPVRLSVRHASPSLFNHF